MADGCWRDGRISEEGAKVDVVGEIWVAGDVIFVENGPTLYMGWLGALFNARPGRFPRKLKMESCSKV